MVSSGYFILLAVIGLASFEASDAQPGIQSSRPCRYRGEIYDSGDRVMGTSLTCTCRNRRWVDCIDNAPEPPEEDQPTQPEEPEESEESEMDFERYPGAEVGALQYMNNFEDGDFVLDFSDLSEAGVPADSTGNGGTSQPANVNTKTVMQVANMAQTRFRINACGINLPHVHPRGTESIYMIDGELEMGFVMENGRTVINTVVADQSTFFPQGLLHYQQNLQCEPAGFISILDSSDPGLLVIRRRWRTYPAKQLRPPSMKMQHLSLNCAWDFPQDPHEVELSVYPDVDSHWILPSTESIFI